MTSNLVQVNWEAQRNVLFTALGFYRNKEIHTDITLQCEGESFLAHRLILSMCSGYFKKALQSSASSQMHVLMCGIRKSILEALLNFIYDGTATIKNSDIPDLIKTGMLLEIPGLMDMGSNLVSDSGNKNIDSSMMSVPSHLGIRKPQTEVVSRNPQVEEANESSDDPILEIGGGGASDWVDESNFVEHSPPKSFNSLAHPIQQIKDKKKTKRIHPCNFCKKSYLHLDSLRSHEKLHAAQAATVFPCSHCNKEFSSERVYLNHVAKCAVGVTQANKRTKRSHSSFSSEDFQSSDDENGYNSRSNAQVSISKNNIDLQTSVATVNHKHCVWCDKSFLSTAKYKKHRKTKCTVLQCQYCLIEFHDDKENYAKHVDDHHRNEEPFQCPKCSFRTDDGVSFEDHISEHTRIYRYWCPLCDFQAAKMPEVKDHAKISHPIEYEELFPISQKLRKH